MQTQNGSNNKPLLYTIIAILVIIIGVLLYMLNNVSTERDNTEKAKTAVEETLKGKEEALAKAELLLEQYQKDSLALAGDNLILSEELVARKKEISKLVADLKSNKARSQSSIDELNRQLADLTARLAQVGDVVIIISNSGVNAAPVEAADLAKSLGATVIALTSRAYSEAAAKGRPTLASRADIVLDNGLPPGDALVALPGSVLKAGPGSTAVGAAMLQALFAEAAARLAADGAPLIFLSANMPGAGENNRELVARYSPRNPHL